MPWVEKLYSRITVWAPVNIDAFACTMPFLLLSNTGQFVISILERRLITEQAGLFAWWRPSEAFNANSGLSCLRDTVARNVL